MYIMKILLKGQLLAVQHYKSFQNAVADIGDKKFCNFLSKEKEQKVKENLGNPEIYHAGADSNGIADDFEFRYSNGVNIYVGTIFPIDYESEERSNTES